MSYYLTIMPVMNESIKALILAGQPVNVLGYERLQFGQDYRILGQINDDLGEAIRLDCEARNDSGIDAVVQTNPLYDGLNVQVYRDEGIRTFDCKSGSEFLRVTSAGELGKIQLPENSKGLNKAILAYVKALPKNTPIILEWS